MGRCTVEATDGLLLGLVGWVINAGDVEVKLSTLKEHSYPVKAKSPFQSATIDRRRGSESLPVRDEAWFLVRFAKMLYGAFHVASEPAASFGSVAQANLSKALALVPERFHVNTRFPRVLTWNSTNLT